MPPTFNLENWLPQEPQRGPPLPAFLGIYWPWYTPPAAEFLVSNLIISPAEVILGQVVTISCTVTNIGTEAGSYKVSLRGDFMSDKEVGLNPGESKTASFEVIPAVAGSHNVSVDGLSGTLEVKAPAPEEPTNGIEIYWHDAEGNPIVHNSPIDLEEGATGYFDVYITNATTKGGVPWDATFDVLIAAQYGTPPFEAMAAPISVPGDPFAAGERKGPYSGSVTPYMGSADRNGSVTVIVSVGGVEIATAVDVVNIIYIPIIYGAIIEW